MESRTSARCQVAGACGRQKAESCRGRLAGRTQGLRTYETDPRSFLRVGALDGQPYALPMFVQADNNELSRPLFGRDSRRFDLEGLMLRPNSWFRRMRYRWRGSLPVENVSLTRFNGACNESDTFRSLEGKAVALTLDDIDQQ